jgi:hypothetical protein
VNHDTETRSLQPHQPVARSERGCRVIDWKPFDTGGLIGKATITFAGGWTVAGIPIFRRADGSLSAGTPDAPLVDASGNQLRDAEGKRRYSKIISFENAAARDRWNRAVLAALADAGIGGAS